MLIWLGPDGRYRAGHDGVSVPGLVTVWKSLGRQFRPVFPGMPSRIYATGRVKALWSFSLRDDPVFYARHPEWLPLK